MWCLASFILAGHVHANPFAELDAAERRRREVMADVFALQETIRVAERKSLRLTERRREATTLARKLGAEVAVFDRRIESGRQDFVQDVRRLYMGRDDTVRATLFSARDFREFDRSRRYLLAAAQADEDKIKSYLQIRAERSLAYKKLGKAARRLGRITRLTELENARLEAARVNKFNLLKEVGRDRANRLAELRAWREAHPDDQPTFLDAKGRLAPPIEGELHAEFGDRIGRDPALGLLHRGRYYSSPAGRTVRAVFDGNVAFAAQLPGLGQTVILDHGGSYYTVYAFADALIVREGARVSAGASIAKSGPGAPLLGPGLYFEVRHFSDAVDPREWMDNALTRSSQ